MVSNYSQEGTSKQYMFSSRGLVNDDFELILLAVKVVIRRRPYLLCHTGNLALRVAVVSPARLQQTFICRLCVCPSVPLSGEGESGGRA